MARRRVPVPASAPRCGRRRVGLYCSANPNASFGGVRIGTPQRLPYFTFRWEPLVAAGSRVKVPSSPDSSATVEGWHLGCREQHRNRESPTPRGANCDVVDFTEVVLESAVYRLSVHWSQFLFLAMSLSGSQFQTTRAGSTQPLTCTLSAQCSALRILRVFPQ